MNEGKSIEELRFALHHARHRNHDLGEGCSGCDGLTQLSAALDELERLRKEREKLMRLAAFFACVLRSGGPWTEICQSKWAEAFP